ncbi:MAG: MFS transporter [Bryobacteraceae bacterium]
MPSPWGLVALLWVVATLNYLDRQVIFSVLPLLQNDLHASPTQLGLIGTVFLWTYGLLAPVAGYIADRAGRVRVILFSLLVWSLVTWLTGYVRTIPELLVTRALMGISEACYLPAALALVVAAHPQRTRSLAAGIHQSGLYTGAILGGAWGGWMGETYGWRPVFSILGVIGLVYLSVLWWFLRRHRESAGETNPLSIVPSMREVLRSPNFGKLAAAFSIVAMANWLIYTWLPLYLVERFQLGLTVAGFSATFYLQAASFAGILVGGTLSDRWQSISPRGRILMQAGGVLLAAPFLFLVGFAQSMPVFIVGIVTFGFGRGVYDCNTMPVLSEFVRPELRSTGYGLLNLFSCLAGGVIAAAAGFFKSSLGLGGAFEVAAGLMVMAGLLLLRTENR